MSLFFILGPIKLLLHWTNNMKQSFDTIADAFADIGLLLPELQQVRRLFIQNEHIKDVLVFFSWDILDSISLHLSFSARRVSLSGDLEMQVEDGCMFGFCRRGLEFRIHVDQAAR